MRARHVGILALVAALAVITASVSCDDDGGTSISSVCSASCRQFEECYEEYFEDQYDDQAECKEECMDDMRESKEEFDDADCSVCWNKYLRYMDCWTSLDCDDLEEWDLEECEDEAEALEDCYEDHDCEEDYYYYD